MSARCIFGHELIGKGHLIEGKCQRVRTCRRCGKDVVEDVPHRGSVMLVPDPQRPCHKQVHCTVCDWTSELREEHTWPEEWTLTDETKNVFTKRCRACRVLLQEEHRHFWEFERTATKLEFEPLSDGDIASHVQYEYWRCKYCSAVDEKKR